MILKRSDALRASKSGVDMWIYNCKEPVHSAALVYQETERGHSDEIRHSKSTFVYYIVEGQGEWVIEGQAFPVRATDVVVVLPGKRFYYRGELKQVCITAPAWEEKFEEVVGKAEF